MARVITYGCKECGCEIIVSGSHESHLRPIFCCGVEVMKIAPVSKETARNKSREKNVATAVKKVTKKTTVKTQEKKRAPTGRKGTGG